MFVMSGLAAPGVTGEVFDTVTESVGGLTPSLYSNSRSAVATVTPSQMTGGFWAPHDVNPPRPPIETVELVTVAAAVPASRPAIKMSAPEVRMELSPNARKA